MTTIIEGRYAAVKEMPVSIDSYCNGADYQPLPKETSKKIKRLEQITDFFDKAPYVVKRINEAMDYIVPPPYGA
ncbi:hypothetical protein H4219_006397, partial [Mycoemilia scoparia]